MRRSEKEVSRISEEVTPMWTHFEAGPTASETAWIKATTSCLVSFSISSTLAASTEARSLMRARSEAGIMPSRA